MRGGEKTLEVFLELLPGAQIFTLVHDRGKLSPRIESAPIETSFIQRLPFGVRGYRYYLPLMPAAIERFDLTPFDLVLSLSHCVAKGAITRPETVHVCYCFTPMRYAWESHHRYFGDKRVGPVGRLLLPPLFTYLRMWDVTSAHRVDHFIAVSEAVARRIKKYYGRDSTVIPCPVETGRFRASAGGDYYLIVSAFAPYKRIDLAIEAFNSLGYPLRVVGGGQDEIRLRARAGRNVEFLGWLTGEDLVEQVEGCKAFLLPGEEDFGIAPVEAMAAGRPVIAFGRGGALETVIPLDDPEGRDPTGVFFFEESAEALKEAIRRFEGIAHLFEPARVRTHAQRYDVLAFRKSVEEFLREVAPSLERESHLRV